MDTNYGLMKIDKLLYTCTRTRATAKARHASTAERHQCTVQNSVDYNKLRTYIHVCSLRKHQLYNYCADNTLLSIRYVQVCMPGYFDVTTGRGHSV